MVKRSICLWLLAALSAAGAVELTFDGKLSGWTRSDRVNIVLDPAEKLSQTGSLRLTSNPNRKYVTLSTTVELKPDQTYEISFMAKAENISDKKTGVFVNAGKKWRVITRLNGTFDWTKYTGVFTPSQLGGSDKVKLSISLFGPGARLWIDQLKIAPKQKEEIAAGEKTNFTAKFYPVYREDNRMTICENLPAILELMTAAPPKMLAHYKDKTSRLTLDLPKYVKFMGSRPPIHSGWYPKKFDKPEKVTLGKTFVRDGVEYQRYTVDYCVFLARTMCQIPNNFKYLLLFEAVPGSAGKTANVYWSLDIGGEKYPEQSFTLKVLPPAKMTEPPCKKFQMSLYRQYTINHDAVSPEGRDATIKFWSSLAEKNICNVMSIRGFMKKFYGDQSKMQLFGNDCAASLNKEELAKIRKVMPLDVSLKGVKKKAISAWALVDDPDKLFETYLRNTVRMAKNNKPQVKIFTWDNEPFGFHNEGCDEGGRKRFAQKMNLDKVPTIEELNGKYKDMYYDYMLKLHTELTRKGARILKEEYPEAELWMCSGNLTAAPPHYSHWSCMDVRTVDDVVDAHYNMPYYTGTVFFDDMDYNVKHLKKPNFPIHYPAFSKPSYNYTPKRTLQNIVGSAAVGCIGAGIGASDIWSGELQTLMARAFSMISRAEKYYFGGTRCDGEITVTPRNAISRKLASGKTITAPDFSQVIRYTAHKRDGKYLVTVLNFHKSMPLVAEVSGKNFKPVLVKVEPEGCEQVGTDLIPPQEELKKEIAAYSGNSDAFKDHVSGPNKAVWIASGSGKALLQLADGKIFAGVDSIGSGQILSLQNAAGKELLNQGCIGKLVFTDKLQPKQRWKTERYGLGKGNVPYLIATTTVDAYETALTEPNPLLGMKIRRKYEVKNGTLQVSFTFTNPTRKEMPLQFRLHNFPWPGFRFKTKNVVLNGQYDSSSEKSISLPDDGKAMTLKAADGGLTDEISFLPKTKFDKILSWNVRVTARKTVEFSVDRKLAPGASATFAYEVQMK